MNFMPSSLTLALWQVRQSWHLLLLTGLGMIAAVVLVCAMPLYSRIALSAGLRSIIRNTPDSTQIILQSPSLNIRSASETADLTWDFNQALQLDVGDFLSQPLAPEIIMQTVPYPTSGFNPNSPSSGNIAQQVILQGYDIAQIAPHIHIAQGRLPQPAVNVMEIALPTPTARNLHIIIGAETNIHVAWGLGEAPLTLRVVGLFDPLSASDSFWHGSGFQFFSLTNQGEPHNYVFQALTSSNALSGTAGGLRITNDQPGMPHLSGSQTWYYSLDTSQLDVARLDDLINGLNTLQGDAPVVTSPTEDLMAYQNRIKLVETPVLLLLAIITAMVLCFVSMISSLLVENRNEAIAILRSRGASRQQIFGAFMLQQIGLGLIILLLGPLCAIAVVDALAHITLSGSDQGALNLLTGNPLPVALSLSGYALITVVTAVLAGIFAINRATQLDVLVLRRQDARNTQSPLWQRFYLDLFAALLALSGYGIALYESSAGTLDEQTQVLILAPLILLTAVCALLACFLLFLRVLPFLLEKIAILAARSNSAIPTLALAQLTRAPRQIVGTTLLLSFTAAFAVFTLFFTASQTQHVIDLATYQAGADFSGHITLDSNSMSVLTKHYSQLNGVISASVGYSGTAFAGDNSPVGIKAVDPNTFAQAIFWSDQYSSQSVSILMQQLHQQRPTAISLLRVPAIVDDITWDRFQLTPGQTFTLADNTSGTPGRVKVIFVAMTRIHHIPTFSNGTDNSEVSNEGLLVDYQTYMQVYQTLVEHNDQSAGLALPPNYFWLHANSNDAALATLRATLHQEDTNGKVFYDRRAIINVLYHDPLYLDLMGVLALGALTPLLLALVGSLIGSGLNVEHRMANIAILRALGTAPRQILSVLTWEQGPVYTTLLLLGIAAGWLLSAMTLPALIVASISTQALMNANTDSGSILDPANLPGIRIIIPTQAAIAVGIMLVACLCALVLVIRTVARPVLKRTLRLHED